MSNVPVASWAPRENSSAGFGARSTYCAVRLPTRSCGQILDQADAAALRRKGRIAHDSSLRIAVGQKVRREIRRHAVQVDMLDSPCDLCLGRIREFELVEDIPGDAGVVVRIPEPVEQRAGIVGTRRGQFLMPRLQADGRRYRRKARIERRHLHLDAGFLLLVGKGLPHAERRGIGGVGEADLVVLVVGSTGPESDGVDRGGVRTVFALGGEFGLVGVDPCLMVGAVDAGDAIEGVGLRGSRRR